MAKSARASVKKASRTKLRERVFGPAEHARLERMEKKLMDLAAQPKPERPDRMEVDTTAQANGATNDPVGPDGDIDMDQDVLQSTSSGNKKPRSKQPTRVSKRKTRKSSTSIVFPTIKKKRKLGSKGRK